MSRKPIHVTPGQIRSSDAEIVGTRRVLVGEMNARGLYQLYEQKLGPGGGWYRSGRPVGGRSIQRGWPIVESEGNATPKDDDRPPVKSGQLRRGDAPVRPVIRVGALRGSRFELEAWDHGQWRASKPRSAANIAEVWPELGTEAELYPPEPAAPALDLDRPHVHTTPGGVTVFSGTLPQGSPLAQLPGVCSERWVGAQCDREPGSKWLCQGHYMQQRRQMKFTALRGQHGALERPTVPVRFEAHADSVQLLVEEAARRGVSEAEVFREALDALADRMGKQP